MSPISRTEPTFCTLAHIMRYGMPVNRAIKPGIKIQSSGCSPPRSIKAKLMTK